MPRFRYRAANAQGHRVSGQLTAANDIDLDLRLRRMGLMLIRARAAPKRALFPGQRIAHPPSGYDYPEGTVWQCECGRTWVSAGPPGSFICGDPGR